MGDVSVGPEVSGGARLDKWSRWTTLLLCGLIGLTVIALVSDGFEAKLLKDIGAGVYNGQPSLTGIAEDNDARQRAIGIVQLCANALSFFVIGRWIYLANLGAREIGASGMAFTPGWSVGWYFVPFANLFKPFQAMREIWCASVDPADWRSVAPPALLGWWWGLWIGSRVLGQVAYRLSQAADGLDGALLANAVTIASDLINIPLCLVLVSIVSSIAGSQRAARARLQAAEGAVAFGR